MSTNLTSYHLSQLLFHLTIRVSKEDSAFVYFQLEANEGLCFYSTLDSSLNGPYRDLDLKGAIEYRPQVMHLLQELEKKFAITYLIDETIKDSP